MDILKSIDEKLNILLAWKDAADEKFNAIFSKLDQHDEKFNAIFSRLDQHDEKFNAIFSKLDQHEEKFNAIFSRLDQHDQKFDAILLRLENSELRAVKFEEWCKNEFQNVSHRFDYVNGRIDGLKIELKSEFTTQLKKANSKIGVSISRMNKRISALEE